MSAQRSAGNAAPLRSFWIAGYESSDHLSGSGLAFDLIDATGQAERVADDYRAACEVGIRSVRESVGWQLVERPYGFDFDRLRVRAETARRFDLQVLWTLCHGDWPHDADVLADDFVERFAAYARKCATVVREFGDADAPIYTPIDEISFLSWGVAETGLFRRQRHDDRHRASEIKERLVLAALAACRAIRDVDPRARFLHTEPLARRAPPGDKGEEEGASGVPFQYEVWDALCGRASPHLGGREQFVNFIGINCYASRQIESRTLAPLPGRRGERRRIPLHRLLADVHARYDRPIVVGERTPIGVDRTAWLRELGDELREALTRGLPVVGACLHPMADGPSWKDPQRWGLQDVWDDVLRPQRHAHWPRSLYLQTLRTVQARVDPALNRSSQWNP